jgi:hypothetical protein
MTDAAFGNVVATASTILGVVLGFWLARRAATKDRKSEALSLLDAARWELMDAKVRATSGGVLPLPIPTIELIVQRGMLTEIPLELRTDILQTRTLVTAYNERLESMIRFAEGRAVSSQDMERYLAEQAKDGQRFIPVLEDSVARIESHLSTESEGWFWRLWNRLWRRKATAATPRA